VKDFFSSQPYPRTPHRFQLNFSCDFFMKTTNRRVRAVLWAVMLPGLLFSDCLLADTSKRASEWLAEYPESGAGTGEPILPDLRDRAGRNGPHHAVTAGTPEEITKRKNHHNQQDAARPPRVAEKAPGRILVKLRAAEVDQAQPGATIQALEGGGAKQTADIEAILGKNAVAGIRQLVRPSHRNEPKQAATGVDARAVGMQRAQMARDRIVQKAKERGLDRWQEVRLAEGANVEEALRLLRASNLVEAAEPDYLFGLSDFVPKEQGGGVSGAREVSTPTTSVSSTSIPDTGSDPRYGDQWHHATSKVSTAWQQLAGLGLEPGGNRDVIVAVIDSGVDYTHPDLIGNMWVNPLETRNSSDSDGNGYVDDVHGINTTAQSGDPKDDHGHGTHVAGIIAAQAGNGLGGVGVAYNVRIMAIKAAQYSGALTSSHIAAGIYYAVENGADVINMSFGGYEKSQLVEDALAVAFGQAVLVAAAGNNGKANAAGCDPNYGVMYPAGYNWVIGVMAQSRTPNALGDNLAGFSNWDCTPRDNVEYEIMAPGVSMLSTLPDGNYSAWDGTSMATPVVAGAAALLRTRWPDRNVHSSRFLMGQLASTGPVLRGRTNPNNGEYKSYRSLDVAAALTNVPKPELAYLEHWLFDSTAIQAGNDDDGIADAGETVDLAIVLRNHWGNASNVTAKLEAWAEGADTPDPYVTMGTGTVNYGSIGAFSQKDNGLIRNADGVVTGVQQPFRFSLAANTPNDHIIPFRLTITARNGLNTGDTTTYTKVARFFLIAQNGKQLPSIISEDMVLNSDTYWIIDGPVLIPSGVTLTITEGTQVQFWSGDPQKVYTSGMTPFLQVEGTLRVEGTLVNPVHLLVSELHQKRPLRIYHGDKADAYSSFLYAVIDNPYFGKASNESTNWNKYRTNVISHCVFRQLSPDGIDGSDVHSMAIKPMVLADHITHSRFVRLGSNNYGDDYWRAFWGGNAHTSLFDHVYFSSIHDAHHNFDNASNNVFLKNYSNRTRPFDQVSKVTKWGQKISRGTAIVDRGTFHSNAILNLWNDPNPNHWMRFSTESPNESPDTSSFFLISHNYWGTTSRTLINAAIIDYRDNFNYPEIVYEPILEAPLAETYPFVVNVQIDAGGISNVSSVGEEEVLFTITFNRDMAPGTHPQVSFGPAAPWTDFTVRPTNGGWINPRTWTGTATITRMTGDGRQYIRVAGAVAADDPWLVTGDDSERFQFEVNTSNLESMNLAAQGGAGYVDLTWSQDDFPLLAGYNMYRSTSSNGTYSRINPVLIPRGKMNFRDTSAQAGRTYYYRFTVMLTDFTESTPSNNATGTPSDGTPPVIQHTPVQTSKPGLSVTIFADVTDNMAVREVKLFTRIAGTGPYTQRAMVKTTGNRYSATLRSSEVVEPGVDYYIEATDGINVTRSGNAASPHRMIVGDAPPPSDVSTLNDLTLSAGTLSPTFASNTTAYTLAVANTMASTTATPSVTNPAAIVKVNGVVVASGKASASIPLAVGSNTIKVLVTAQNGDTMTYTVTVTRAASSVATLRSLVLSAGSLSPTFASNTTAYTLAVANTMTSTTVTPTVENSTAKVKVNGVVVASGKASASIPLAVGSNTIKVLVTAQNGTTKTYTVTVTRAASSVATLNSLTLSAGSLMPAFAPGTSKYTLAVANAVASTTVTPKVTNSKARVEVNGAVVQSGQTSDPIPLAVGANTIKVEVIAQNGTTNITYTITVTRAASSVAWLKKLTVKGGSLSPKFAKKRLNYKTMVSASKKSIQIQATTAHPKAKIKIAGKKVGSGKMSKPIALNSANTTIKVAVTAEDGTKKTYKITATRP
jgi:subtilisin family serine protease